MLTVFYGTDVAAIRQAAQQFLLDTTDLEQSIERLTGELITSERLLDAATSVSLFGQSPVTVLDTPSEAGTLEVVTKVAKALATSPNNFILIENSLTVPIKKALTTSGVQFNEFKKADTKRSYDPFAVATALLAKDKKSLWLCIMEAQKQGIPAEETVGILWWQLKTMRLVARYPSATAAGVAPYAYDKTKRALAKFTTKEVDALAFSLLETHAKARNGGLDLGAGLERWVLQV